MAQILATLRQEHEETSRLLDVLGRQVGLLEDDGSFDSELITLATYFTSFPARFHHEKEELLVRKLETRDHAAAAAVRDIKNEHKDLAEAAQSLTEMAQGLDSHQISFGDFTAHARRFIDLYRQHIETEESYIFPAAEWSLTIEDWRELDDVVAATESDRLG